MGAPRTFPIMITGRTKHYISLCGEHMSVENMNSAIAAVQEQFNVAITEFAVAGIRSGTLFGHKWFVSCDDTIDSEKLIEAIDEQLKNLNDDYRTERGHGLKELQIEVMPLSYFHRYLEKKGKLGGQNKFPRVLKKHQMEEFEELIQDIRNGG